MAFSGFLTGPPLDPQGADDTDDVMTLTDGRRVETPAKLLAVLTEWHHRHGSPSAGELDSARRILTP